MTWLIILAFAVSSSIDNLGVGISYGIRKIKIGVGANCLIAVVCFVLSMGGITFGMLISKILPGILPVIFGAFLLVVIGIRVILLAKPSTKKDKELSTISGILKNPEVADIDQSGHIGWLEAIFLGIALSANALANGLGAGLLGLSPLAISITAAIGSFVSIWVGVKAGRKLADVRIGTFSMGQFGTILSGIIIVIIAISTFLNL